jgi:opacity protein-like surface antigen
MKFSKIVAIAVMTVALSSSVVAEESNAYLGFKIGSLSGDKTFIGKADDNSMGAPVYNVYDGVDLMGLEFAVLINEKDSYLSWGAGVELMLNEQSFLDGGLLGADIKLGGYYEELNVYGMIGYGLQSLSSYTVAFGHMYGVGISYNLLESLALKAEYKIYNFETGDDEELASSQKYEISGATVGISYRF